MPDAQLSQAQKIEQLRAFFRSLPPVERKRSGFQDKEAINQLSAKIEGLLKEGYSLDKVADLARQGHLSDNSHKQANLANSSELGCQVNTKHF